jgi:hypothetical protein
MSHRTTRQAATIIAVLGLQAACASNGGSPNSSTGGAPGVGGVLGAAGGTSGGGGGGGEADSCLPGRCTPRGFPFVDTAIAASDTCGGNCPILAADTPSGKTTATLRQPEAGTLCLSGVVSSGGWATIGLVFAVWAVEGQARTDMNQPRTEILKKFNADALGITQVAFTIDSPPSEGVSVSAAITTATSCPEGASGCVTIGFDLMTGPGSSVQANFAKTESVVAPFANFMQTVGTQGFDTAALQHLVFTVGSGSYAFCVRDFRFLDAQGNQVMDTQQLDGGI